MVYALLGGAIVVIADQVLHIPLSIIISVCFVAWLFVPKRA